MYVVSQRSLTTGQVQSQSFASNIFFHQQTGETTSKFSPFAWETWMILTRKRLLVDIFLTRRVSKSLAFCELINASVNFESCLLLETPTVRL